MSASGNDLFQKVGMPGTATTLSAPGYTIGDSSVTIGSTADFPNDTGVIFSIDVAEVVNGEEVRQDGSYCVFQGVVTSGTTIGSLVLLQGNPQNYAGGALTRVYITVSSEWANRVITGILEEHKQTGAHKDVTADSLAVSGSSTLHNVVISGNLTISGNSDAAGWSPLGVTPNTVTYNGNRFYSLVFNGTDLTGIVSNSMRLKTVRTVSAPTQCTSLNGTTQYYSKSSPAGMTFTDDFVTGGWYKPSAYAAASAVLQSRYNGTSGWELIYEISGQITLAGFNGGSGNNSYIRTYRSIPLNKWTHIAAQLDMSAFTASTTTSYIMIDGVDVPCLVGRAGTNPTALVQAGNLEIGSANGGTLPFPGKIAQAFVTNAKVTQATIRSNFYAQSISPTETSLISAYSFNNSINDLNANANNLTANGVAVATNADSPFTQDDSGTPGGTTDSCVITGKTFSTNTTLTVQVPEGCTIPTSGGVSAVSYSAHKAPYGFRDPGNILSRVLVGAVQTTAGTVDLNGWTTTFTVPDDCRTLSFECSLATGSATSNTQWILNVYDGASITRVFYGYTGNGSNAFTYTFAGKLPVTPGSHTFKLNLAPSGSNITTSPAPSTGTINEMSFSRT